MSSSNPNSCVNCNIQNSNPSINNSGGSGVALKILVPPKRYNPALASPITTSSTSDIVNRIINVASQSVVVNSSTKKSGKSNTQTASILSKILNVESDIQQSDIGRRMLLESSRSSMQQTDNKKKDTTKVFITQPGRVKKKLTAEETITVKKKDKVKKKKKYRTVGTVLASDPRFQAKFNILIGEKPKLLMKIGETKDMLLPPSLDGRVIWKPFIQPVRSQGRCGSCWAFSSLFCLASRLSIYSKGKYNYNLSPAKMVYCSISLPETSGTELEKIKAMLLSGQRYDYNQKTLKKEGEEETYGCSGETLINTWQFLYRFGVPEDSCLLYGDERGASSKVKFNLTLQEDVVYTCSDFVSDSYDYCPSSKSQMLSHKAGGYYFVPGVKNEEDKSKSGSEYNIRKELYKWGPCTSGMLVYEDLINWTGSGVYEYDKKSEKIGGHAIVIMGWGEQNGKKYWLVRNSWGEDWGDKGYFKILRGVNHFEIEENVFVGFPNVPGIRLYIDYPILFQEEDYVSKYLYNIHDTGYKNTTYEQIALGKIKNIQDINYLYDIKKFPDFSNFAAGIVWSKDWFIFDDEKDLNILSISKKLINFKYILIIILVIILFLF